jgi:tripartite-type tricarboxylate transporter receptor subunit TctC
MLAASLLAGAFLCAALSAPARAVSSDEDAHYFDGKTIKIISTFGAGGGNDVVARSFAPFAPKYFPKTRFIVQNIAGGNGDAGAATAAHAKPDGLTLVVLWNGFYLGSMLGAPHPGWSWTDFKPVIAYAYPPDSYPVAVRKDFATSWEQIASGKAGVWKIGSTFGYSDIDGVLLLAGYPMKIVTGYGTNVEAMAAADRGEVDTAVVVLANFLDNYPNWFRSGKMIPLFRTFPAPIPEAAMKTLGLEKQPPYVLDVVKLPPDLKQIYEMGAKLPKYHMLYAPAGVPPDILAALRAKMVEVVRDPEFVKWVAARGTNANYVTGEELSKDYEKIQKESGVQRKLLAFYFSGDPRFLEGTPYADKMK